MYSVSRLLGKRGAKDTVSLNFSWVIEKKLAGSRGPRSNQDLLWLKEQGIGALVRLIVADEAWVTCRHVNDLGLEDYNEPVRDFAAPTQTQIDNILTWIDSHLERGVPVGVSCNAGIGRSGVILACYLVSKGLTATEALELVRKKRGRGPEILEQLEAVITYWRRKALDSRNEAAVAFGRDE
jgi:atypical dual specificity phosphatase